MRLEEKTAVVLCYALEDRHHGGEAGFVALRHMTTKAQRFGQRENAILNFAWHALSSATP